MSYCRWSSDDWKCDIYAYESGEGYVIHVAGRKRVGDIPTVPNILETEPEEWGEAYRKQLRALEAIPLVDIDLPFAGETFVEPTLQSFHDRMMELRRTGYHIPDYVMFGIQEEMRLQAEQEAGK